MQSLCASALSDSITKLNTTGIFFKIHHPYALDGCIHFEFLTLSEEDVYVKRTCSAVKRPTAIKEIQIIRNHIPFYKHCQERLVFHFIKIICRNEEQ